MIETKKYSVIPIVSLLTLLFFVACSQRSSNTKVQSTEDYKKNLVSANKGLVELDQERIKNYVQRRNWNMEITETGMWFQIVNPNQNQKAETGKIAYLKYQVTLLDGTLCYSSDSLGIMQFLIGKGGVESGLEEAILMMRVGEKGRFILPPHLAHGLLGDENKIPPRSVIVYNAELLKLTEY